MLFEPFKTLAALPPNQHPKNTFLGTPHHRLRDSSLKNPFGEMPFGISRIIIVIQQNVITLNSELEKPAFWLIRMQYSYK
jgi:hypothetical protein